MGGALTKFWAWWQYSDKEGSYPEPCSPSYSSSVSCDELEEFNTEAAEIHESSSSTATNYDVFLSFSGQDTRLSFTGHLYNALVKDGVVTFMDEEELKQGEEIASSLIKAVAESRISIPIFSTNYASSKWCLNELVEIMKSRDTMGQIVFPIFYHVNPRDVRKQTGNFGQKFDELAKNLDSEKVESWKKALKQAGSLKGHDLKTMYNGNGSCVPGRSYYESRISVGQVLSKSGEDQINMLYLNEHHPFVSNLEEGDGISFQIGMIGRMKIKKAGLHVFYRDTNEATILRMEDFFSRLPHNDDDDVDGGEPSCRERARFKLLDLHDDGGEPGCRERTRFKLLDLHDDGGEPSRSRKRKFQVLDHDDNDDDDDVDDDVGGVSSSKRTKFQLLDHDHDHDHDDNDDGDDDDEDEEGIEGEDESK